jgi:lipopolysaccharide heptosyltransferase II
LKQLSVRHGCGVRKLKIKLLKYLDQLLGRLLVSCLPIPVAGESCPPHSVLFIRPGGIGDAVLLIPTISAVKKHYPETSINVLAEKRNAQIFALCPEVDDVYCYDQLPEFWKVLPRRYDLIIDTEQWHRLSAVIARLIRSKRKIGYATNERSKLFTDPISYSHDDYEALSFCHLLQPLSADVNCELKEPFLIVPGSVKSAEKLLPRAVKNYVVLFPGASIPERRWGGQRFAELAERIAALDYPVVVVGGKEDFAVGEAVVAKAQTTLNVAGKTSLLETASILKDAALLISGDSGVLHIAVGLGTPTVSLFGPGIVNKWAPHGSRHTVINHQLPCSPCTKFGTTPPCPIGAKCLKGISVDEVFSAVEALLNKINQNINDSLIKKC